jgi:hypothetical protein
LQEPLSGASHASASAILAGALVSAIRNVLLALLGGISRKKQKKAVASWHDFFVRLTHRAETKNNLPAIQNGLNHEEHPAKYTRGSWLDRFVSLFCRTVEKWRLDPLTTALPLLGFPLLLATSDVNFTK